MLLALVRFLYSVVAQLQHSASWVINYINWHSHRCKKIAAWLSWKGEWAGAWWAVKGAGICLSASLVSLFWLSWTELFHPGCAAAQHPPPARSWWEKVKKLFCSMWLQVLAQKREQWEFPSGKLSTLLSFFLMLEVQTVRKNHQYLFTAHMEWGEGMKEIWKYELWRKYGNIFRLWLRMFCYCWALALMFYLLDSIEGLEVLKLSH